MPMMIGREIAVMDRGPLDGYELDVDANLPPVLAFESRQALYVLAGRRNKEGYVVYQYDQEKSEHVRRRMMEHVGQ